MIQSIGEGICKFDESIISFCKGTWTSVHFYIPWDSCNQFPTGTKTVLIGRRAGRKAWKLHSRLLMLIILRESQDQKDRVQEDKEGRGTVLLSETSDYKINL
jgi:hypothetical protein